MADGNINDKVFEKVDSNRRGFLKRLLGAGFAAPVIATFAVEALSVDSANAEAFAYPNQTGVGSDTGLDTFSFWFFGS